MSNIETKIHATKVANNQRMAFMPKLFGRQYLRGEHLIYTWMRELCKQYQGGYWEFFELSNSGMYMAPNIEGSVEMSWALNYSREHISSDAAGIVATIFALNQVISSGAVSEALIEKFYALRDYAGEHAEAGAIYRLID